MLLPKSMRGGAASSSSASMSQTRTTTAAVGAGWCDQKRSEPLFTSVHQLCPAPCASIALEFWQGASAQVRERVEAAAAGVGSRGLGPLVVFPEASAPMSVTSSLLHLCLSRHDIVTLLTCPRL